MTTAPKPKKSKPPRTLAEWRARHGVPERGLDAVVVAIAAIARPSSPLHKVALGALTLGELGKPAQRELLKLTRDVAHRARKVAP